VWKREIVATAITIEFYYARTLVATFTVRHAYATIILTGALI
jgi:hypothetical protein